MGSQSFLFRLPRELRDEIYGHYFELPGGYSFNPETGKLTSSNRQPVDLSLRFACRLVAKETYGIALKLNIIHFSTWYSGTTRESAGRFNTLIRIIADLKTGLLLNSATFSGCVDDTVYDYVAQHFPQFLQTISPLQQRAYVPTNSVAGLKEIPSLHREFTASTMRFVSTQPNFHETVSGSRFWKDLETNIMGAIGAQYDPWAIPSEDDITTMTRAVAPRRVEATIRYDPTKYWNKLKYRFSAAAAAIHFLERSKVRSQIRSVVLHEDHVAVAWPECHAQGLIPYCQENPRLQIERRVSLWQNAFHTGTYPFFALVDESPEQMQRLRVDGLRSEDISHHGVAPWVMEALALPSLGMPAKSFTLVLDGNPLPEKTTQIFQDIVQRDAAWQTAFEIFCSDRATWTTPPPAYKHRQNITHILNGFPKAMRDITNGDSIVKCNFDVGRTWDEEKVARIVEEGRSWSLKEWEERWRADAHMIETEAPLPCWLDLRREDVLP